MNQKNNTNSNPLGVLVGFLLCGLVSLVLPNYLRSPDVVVWILDIVGYFLLLIGVMMACMEAFKL